MLCFYIFFDTVKCLLDLFCNLIYYYAREILSTGMQLLIEKFYNHFNEFRLIKCISSLFCLVFSLVYKEKFKIYISFPKFYNLNATRNLFQKGMADIKKTHDI